MNRTPLALPFLLLAAPILGQQTWNVTAGSPIQPIVDAAAPGDIVLLEPGAYERFDLPKGLTIIGPGAILRDLDQFSVPAVDLTIDIPSGQVARLVGIEVIPNSQLIEGGTTFVNGGVVVFEDCEFQSGYGSLEAIRVADADVVFDHCLAQTVFGSVTNQPAALRSVNANISATNTEFRGGPSTFNGLSGHGIRANGTGSLHLSHCECYGGRVFGAFSPPGHGVFTSVPTWITDCTIEGGDANGLMPGPGAAGLRATTPCEIARCSILGGLAQPSGIPVAPTIGPVSNNPALLGVRSIQPTDTIGSTFDLTFTAHSPGISVAILVSIDSLGPSTTSPDLDQRLWSDTWTFVGMPATTASSTATLTIPIPNDPLLLYQTYDFVGFRLAGGQVQSSPVVPATLN